MKIKRKRIYQALYFGFTLLLALGALRLLAYGMLDSDWHDFDVFYNAAKAALTGNSIYTITGKYQLPFWYLPWTAWFYIPLAIWPHNIALILYKGISVLCAILIVNHLTAYYQLKLTKLDRVFIFVVLVPLTFQLMIVGQMDYILLAMIIITMFAIEQKMDLLAGAIMPFLWIKPHLLIVFTLFAFWRAGKRAIFVSAGISVIMLILETLLAPGWIADMLTLLRGGTQRTESVGFTTLPNLLGSQENWVGTANLPFTIILILLAIVIVWKFRQLPTIPLLTLALTASLFCAPRAHAYDLTLLIPALFWLTTKKFTASIWLWVLAAFIPLLTLYTTGAYLLTLLIFALSIWKAYQMSRVSNPVSPLELPA